MTKSTVNALIAGGGLLVTWLAVVPNHNVPSKSAAPPAQRTTATRETTAEELNAQATKLRGHLSGPLRPSTRNPFRFGSSKSRTRSVGSMTPALPTAGSGGPPAAPSPPLTPPPPTFKLSGVGERNTPEGRKRTAVITAGDQLYVVAEGGKVAGSYTVARIDPEAVVLRDSSGLEITLVLH